MFKNHLFPPGKTEYIMRKKQGVLNNKCILCGIRDNEADVIDLSLYRTENFIVTVNLYPYNPGHIMIFPKKHIEHLSDFPEEHHLEFLKLQKTCIKVLDNVYGAKSFNIGFNIGKDAGASIDHIHLHIVPRFPSELGFVDILSGAKITIENPDVILKKLKKQFEKIQ